MTIQREGMMLQGSENRSQGVFPDLNNNETTVSNMSVQIASIAVNRGIQLAGWRWNETSTFIVVSLFLLTGSLVKLAYHHTSLHQHLPESCILILLGTGFEMMSFLSHFQAYIPRFSSDVFFFLLLPPIILESAYSLHDRIFFTNLGTILLYAIAGTLINIFTIGPSLFLIGLTGLFGAGINLTLIECLIFSTLISAVDPVAVLAIFQEIGVNKALYFLVFGESLLNDAVVITLYNSICVFAGTVAITPMNVFLGALNFITVSGGGLAIGIVWGILTAIITKFTQEVRVVEPMIVIVIAYLSYVTSELFHFSGIIGIIGCGLMQLEYAKYNISNRSYITIKYFTRNVSTIADVIIFFFLGKVLVRETHVWSTSFVLISTLLCIIYRFLSVFSLTYIANNVFHRIHRIKLEEQLVMAYGGLRGAIAFSLAVSLDEKEVANTRLFVSSTLFVILFTVFVLGSTTKTIVRLLRVKTEEKEDPKMFLFTNDKMIEGLMSGLEDVTGHQTYFHLIHRLNAFNEKYVKRFLVKDWVSNYTEFTTTYQKVRAKATPRPKSILSSHNALSVVRGSAEQNSSSSGSSAGEATATAAARSNSINNHSASGSEMSTIVRSAKKTAFVVSPIQSPVSSSPAATAKVMNGSISVYDQAGRVSTSSTSIVTDDEGLVNKIRGARQAFADNHSNINNESVDQPRWQLIKNVVNFTSRMRSGTTSSTDSKVHRRRRSSQSPSSSTSSRKQSMINIMREDSEERESNQVRRQLTSALNRTSFFQLPGSIFIEDIEDDAMKRRSATRMRIQRGSIPDSIGAGSHLHASDPLSRVKKESERRRSSVHEETVSRTLSIKADQEKIVSNRPGNPRGGGGGSKDNITGHRSSIAFP